MAAHPSRSPAPGTETADVAISAPVLYQYARLGAWRRQASSNYLLCQTQMLEWPALAVEWIPDRYNSNFPDLSLHHVAVGSHALPGQLNYISVVEFVVPVDMEELAEYLEGEDGAAEAEGAMFADVKGHARLAQVLPVDGIVHKIRAMPQSGDLVAVQTSGSPAVQLFRLNDRPLFSAEPADHTPDLRLSGFKSPGFAMSWSSCTPGRFAGGSDDGRVYMWDLAGPLDQLYEDEPGAKPVTGTSIAPETQFRGHTDEVHAISCHAMHDHLVASCSQSGEVLVWDARAPNVHALRIAQAHAGGTMSCEFHPTAIQNLLTCGADGIVSMWDMRKPEASSHDLMYHTGVVAGAEWAPFSDTALLSYGVDGNVCLWDLSRAGMTAAREGDQNAPSELAFVHAGHMSRVTDARWCLTKDEEWLAASVDASNMLQVYRPTRETIEEHLPPDEFDLDDEER